MPFPPVARHDITSGYNRIERDLCRAFRHCERGSNAVEFALVAPLLCFMLLAMVYLGIYLGTAHSLAQVAADVSRYAMVGRDRTERNVLAQSWMTTSGASYSLVNRNRMTLRTDEADDLMTVSIVYDISYLPIPPLLSQTLDLKGSIVKTAAVHIP
jgi:Flp pilus assembly protein TadG